MSSPTAIVPDVLNPGRRRAAPFDAVDVVDVVSPDEVIARRLIRRDDPYLSGHYPDHTIYPGVFVIESVYAAVAALVAHTHGNAVLPEPAVLELVRFTSACAPGDVLEVHCGCRANEAGQLVVHARCTSSARMVAQLRVRFRLIEVTTSLDPGSGERCSSTQTFAG